MGLIFMSNIEKNAGIALGTEMPRAERLRALGHVAWATFHDDPMAKLDWMSELFASVTSFEVGPHWGVVASNSEITVLAFRGTDSNEEWAQSITYRQVPWFEGKAHGGFVAALESVWEPMMAALYDEGVLEREKTFWVCGHSLGGALALLAADRLHREGFTVAEVATYGTPCCYDPLAAEQYPIPVYRVANNEDPVAAFSWPTLFESYACVGEEVFLLASGAAAESRHSRDLARKIDRANSIGEGILPAGMIHDHFMREYVRKLDLWAASEAARVQ